MDALFKQHGEILQRLVAKSYEDATEQFISAAISAGKLPHFNSLGRWWDGTTEIDLVGLNEEDNTILFVETKWSNQQLRTDILDSLKQKAQQIVWGKPNRKEHFALVSKSGFSSELVEHAKAENALLIVEDKLNGV